MIQVSLTTYSIRHRAFRHFGVFGSQTFPSSILTPLLHPLSSPPSIHGPGSEALGMPFDLWDWCLGWWLGVVPGIGVWDWGLGFVLRDPDPPLGEAIADTQKHLQKQTPIFDPILPSGDPKSQSQWPFALIL